MKHITFGASSSTKSYKDQASAIKAMTKLAEKFRPCDLQGTRVYYPLRDDGRVVPVIIFPSTGLEFKTVTMVSIARMGVHVVSI